jgi:hypothetical protein
MEVPYGIALVYTQRPIGIQAVTKGNTLFNDRKKAATNRIGPLFWVAKT